MFKFEDKKQQIALSRLIKFFAIMLVLTFIARGTAGVTMPRVTTASPVNATIVQKIETSGVISTASGIMFKCPEGITVEKLFKSIGEKVDQKDKLVIFNAQEIENAIKMQNAELSKMNVQYKQLKNTNDVDAYGVGVAQSALDKAYAEQSNITKNSDAAIATATDKCNVAQTLLIDLKAVTPPDLQAIDAADKALQTARAELEAAIDTAKQSTVSATAAAEAAESTRNSALHSYNLAKEQATNAGDINKADANILAVQIEIKKSDIAKLLELKANGNALLAPISGTMQEWKLAEGMPSTKIAGNIADTNSELELSFKLSGEDATKITLGTTVKIMQGDKEQSAKITLLSLPDDSGNITASVRLKEDNLNSGACKIAIETSRTEHSLCVPNSAIYADSSGKFVYLIEKSNTVLGIQNTLVRIAVNIEEVGETQTAVNGAITADSLIVNTSTKLLSKGVRVRIEE